VRIQNAATPNNEYIIAELNFSVVVAINFYYSDNIIGVFSVFDFMFWTNLIPYSETNNFLSKATVKVGYSIGTKNVILRLISKFYGVVISVSLIN
jgi:hypothetical protein